MRNEPADGGESGSKKKTKSKQWEDEPKAEDDINPLYEEPDDIFYSQFKTKEEREYAMLSRQPWKIKIGLNSYKPEGIIDPVPMDENGRAVVYELVFPEPYGDLKKPQNGDSCRLVHEFWLDMPLALGIRLPGGNHN